MMRLEQGEVLRILDQRPGLQELLVKVGDQTERAILYTDLSASVAPNQTVWLNTTAVRLGLGSGGCHFAMPSDLGGRAALQGHIMKMRYTPQQIRVLSCEEAAHPLSDLLREKDSLEGMPVAAAELHSMLPAIAGSFAFLLRDRERPPRIVYVMTDGGALPISYSKTVAELKGKGLLAGTVTVGHAYGGDLEAVNLYSGLLAAKHILHADLTIVAMGPGIVGTGSRFGHSGIEQGQVVNAVASLQGTALVCPRISFADARSRHQGLSHHTLTVLSKVALARAIVAMPILQPEQMADLLAQLQMHRIAQKHEVRFEEGQVVQQAADYYRLNLSTMERDFAEEQAFFLAAGATGKIAARLFTNPDRLSTAGDAG